MWVFGRISNVITESSTEPKAHHGMLLLNRSRELCMAQSGSESEEKAEEKTKYTNCFVS